MKIVSAQPEAAFVKLESVDAEDVYSFRYEASCCPLNPSQQPWLEDQFLVCSDDYCSSLPLEQTSTLNLDFVMHNQPGDHQINEQIDASKQPLPQQAAQAKAINANQIDRDQRMLLVESFIRAENHKIQQEKQRLKQGSISKSKAIPKFFNIELIKDNECVDSLNKSDNKDPNNNGANQDPHATGSSQNLAAAKENSEI